MGKGQGGSLCPAQHIGCLYGFAGGGEKVAHSPLTSADKCQVLRDRIHPAAAAERAARRAGTASRQKKSDQETKPFTGAKSSWLERLMMRQGTAMPRRPGRVRAAGARCRLGVRGTPPSPPCCPAGMQSGICMATFQLNAAPEDTGDIPCTHPCLQQPPGVYQAPLRNLGMMGCSQTFPGK